MKIICTYIRRNSVWTEIQCSQLYKRRIFGNRIRTYLKNKSTSWNIFVRTLHKILFFRKIKKSMKYNVFRTIIFCSPPQNIFIFLCALEKIKFLWSTFRKRRFYFEELFHWYIPEKFINKKLSLCLTGSGKRKCSETNNLKYFQWDFVGIGPGTSETIRK